MLSNRRGFNFSERHRHLLQVVLIVAHLPDRQAVLCVVVDQLCVQDRRLQEVGSHPNNLEKIEGKLIVEFKRDSQESYILFYSTFFVDMKEEHREWALLKMMQTSKDKPLNRSKTIMTRRWTFSARSQRKGFLF